MDGILNDFSARAMAAAIEDNLLKYYQYLGRSDNVELYDNPNLTGFFTGIPHPFMNGFFCTQLMSSDAIKESLTSLKSRKVPFMWWIGSGAQSADWGKQLESHGLVYREDFSGMAADLLALKEDLASLSGLTIEPVSDKETLEQWVNAAFIGFRLPGNSDKACFNLFAGLGFDMPLRNYVAFMDGKPIATSQLFLAAGVAGIYWVTTIPAARRQGIGMAMTLAPLREASAMGYRISILHPSDMARGLYRGLGFEDYGKLCHGIWIGETQQ
ncbi:MAG: GNAT family N-acetyltransferase [Desulfobacterales bacterium]|nr:MAG: GNAT family N-acetyltransferase [Desulfobacterales bacterium]